MRFEFATADRICFGPGVVSELPSQAARLGSRALLVTGRDAARHAAVVEALSARVVVTAFAVEGEPTLEQVRRGVGCARQAGCDLVIGLGGGSALDTAKAVAALSTNEGDPLEYLEVIGQGRALERSALACIAVPTTAGTGSEVTKNAVLASREHKVKVSLRSPLMLPTLALVDPELTLDLPPAITAATGLDALTQLIEPYVCKNPNPAVDGLCEEGIRRVARSLRRACSHGADRAAREDLALASLFGGLGLANARLGAVHGFAGPIGGTFVAPHGAVCARLLPRVMECNIRLLRKRDPASEPLERYEWVGRLLTGRSDAGAGDGVRFVDKLCVDLGIPPLSAHGIQAADLTALAAQAACASSMQGNPVTLTQDEMVQILSASL